MNLVINAQLHRTQQSASLILISEKQTNPSFTLMVLLRHTHKKSKNNNNKSFPPGLHLFHKYKKINAICFDSISNTGAFPTYWIPGPYKNIKKTIKAQKPFIDNHDIRIHRIVI